MDTMDSTYVNSRNVEAWLGSTQVFNQLTLRLHLGEHTVIVGPNGAGKSSLIKLITRQIYPVVKPNSWFRLFGQDGINLWELRRRIGLLSQDMVDRYNPTISVRDVVRSGFFGSIGISCRDQLTNEQDQRVECLLSTMQMIDLASRCFGQLSDGQRRRVLLARAMVYEPDVLILDEPTNALDIPARHHLLALLRQLATNGTTLLLVTHQLEAIIPDFSRAILIQKGEVYADGSIGSTLNSEKLSKLFETPLRVLEANGYLHVVPG